MSWSKWMRVVVLLAVLIAGVWLLAAPTRLQVESAQRRAVVGAFGPAGMPARPAVADEGLDGAGMVQGRSAAPALVSMADAPPAVPGKHADMYYAGELNLEPRPESPLSEAEIARLIEESLAQGVSRNVQIAREGVGLHAIPLSFNALRYSNTSGLTPPDAEIAVGQDHIVEVVNSTLAVYEKRTGVELSRVDMDVLFASACGSGGFYFDPVAVYDDENDRYVVSIIVDEGSSNHFCVAASQADDPTKGWYVYNFDCNPGPGTNYFCDYHRIAAGQDALYVTANMFNFGFLRNHVFAFEKDAMYAGASAAFVKFDVGSSYFTLNPTKLLGYNFGGWPADPNEPHYIVTTPTLGGSISIFGFNDPWGSPSLSLVTTLPASSFSFPVSSVQQGGSSITSNDGRLLDAKYWGGRIWATQHAGCNPGGGTVNCVRWYEVDMTGVSPTLVQEGTYGDSGQYRYFPDLAVNGCGQMLVGYTKSSSSLYPSVYVAGRNAGTPPNTLIGEIAVHTGTAPHVCYDGSPYRWGDYLDMTVDPVDGRTFWYVGQFSSSQPSCNWATQIAAIRLGQCNP